METAYIEIFQKYIKKVLAKGSNPFYSYRPRKGTGLQNSEIARGQKEVRLLLA